MGTRLHDLETELDRHRAAGRSPRRPAAAPPLTPARAPARAPTPLSLASPRTRPRRVRSLGAVSYRVPGIVPVVGQPSNMSCWAASTTMLMCWRHRASMTIETAMGTIGQRWLDLFNRHKADTNTGGLPAADTAAFIADAGLVAEPPASHSVEGYEGMLMNYGPLMITTNERPETGWAIHARIMTGISGDGSAEGTHLDLIDPGHGGRAYRESFAVFWPKFEDEVRRSGYMRIQVVHWPLGTSGDGMSSASSLRARYTTPASPPAAPRRAWSRGPRALSRADLRVGDRIPDVDEAAAVGAATQIVRSGSDAHKHLVEARNPDIAFRSLDGRPVERLVTPKLADRLNRLADLVRAGPLAAQLRVVRGWDGETAAGATTHSEGRGADLALDLAPAAPQAGAEPLGTLARLAVEAGFEFVHFEDPAFIHVAVLASRSCRGGGGAATVPRSRSLTVGGHALSEAGARFIARHEGLATSLYNDPAGHCTIGYGHLVHRGNCNGAEPEEFRAGISEGRALELLRADGAGAEGEVNRSVAVPLVQHQFDALVSFAYNVGTGAFRGSTLLRRLNGGEYDAVPGELNRWVNADGIQLPGLVARRRREGGLFSTGNYDAA